MILQKKGYGLLTLSFFVTIDSKMIEVIKLMSNIIDKEMG